MKQITFTMPQDSKSFLDLMQTHGSKKCVNVGDNSIMVTMDDADTVTSMPYITDIQLRLALIDLNLADAVECFVAQSDDKKIKAWWDRAIRFERDNPMVEAVAKSLGVTQKQLDGLWLLAVTL